MKKLIVMLSLSFLLTGAIVAQNGNVNAAAYEVTLGADGNLEKAKEKIDEAVKHEKTMNSPKTYIVKSQVYRALYKRSVEKNSENPDSKLIYEAFDAIKKAEVLDKKGDAKGKKIGKEKENIEKEVMMLRADVLNDGIAAYNRKDYKAAVIGFNNTMSMDSMDASARSAVDTAIMFNAAIAAYYDQQHDLAIDYLHKVKDLGYGDETPLLMLYTEYRDLKDTTKMVETLKEGFEKYPENDVFIKDLVVYYINNNKMEEGMEYIDKALERDPTNTGYWFAKGTFFDKNGETEEAINAYQKVYDSSDDPEVKYNAYYNIGVIYYNKAVEEYEVANAIQDYNKYKAAVAVANEKMLEVLPYFEKCVELKPDDKPTLSTLSSVYYRLSKDNPEMQKKYQQVETKLKSL